jgi:hypothetical protein
MSVICYFFLFRIVSSSQTRNYRIQFVFFLLSQSISSLEGTVQNALRQVFNLIYSWPSIAIIYRLKISILSLISQTGTDILIRLYAFSCNNHLIQAFNTCTDFCLSNLFLFILQKSSILSWYID